MIVIDKTSELPVYAQLVRQIELGILRGLYLPGDQLPSVRELSVTLGINPNTISKSYAELIRKGVIVSAHGSGSYVSPDAPALLAREAEARLPELKELIGELLRSGVDGEAIRRTAEEALREKGDG